MLIRKYIIMKVSTRFYESTLRRGKEFLELILKEDTFYQADEVGERSSVAVRTASHPEAKTDLVLTCSRHCSMLFTHPS